MVLLLAAKINTLSRSGEVDVVFYSRLRLTHYPVQGEVDVVLLLAAKINTVSR